jgi:hypothetical protein
MPPVQLVPETIQSAKEIVDIRVAIRNLVVNAKKALADGFQAGQDIPVVVMGSMADLLEALKGADQVDDAFKEELAASLNALAPLPGELVELLKKKSV